MSENPYASSATILKQEEQHPHEIVLASRFRRVIARFIDALLEGLFYWAFVTLPPGVSDLLSQTNGTDSIPQSAHWVYDPWLWWVIPDFSLESLVYWLISIGITFICQAYLLAQYGQTIGKRVLKIKIVSENGYKKPTLSRSFVVRECGIYVLNWIPILAIVELLWIFGESRKCLHDHWSSTIVINAST